MSLQRKASLKRRCTTIQDAETQRRRRRQRPTTRSLTASATSRGAPINIHMYTQPIVCCFMCVYTTVFQLHTDDDNDDDVTVICCLRCQAMCVGDFIGFLSSRRALPPSSQPPFKGRNYKVQSARQTATRAQNASCFAFASPHLSLSLSGISLWRLHNDGDGTI